MSGGPRVLQIDDGRGWRGGQHQVWLLLKELKGEGVAQWLAAPEGSPLIERTRELEVEVFPVNMRGEWDFSAKRKIADFAERNGINIIHAHTAHAHAIGLAASKRSNGKARMLTTRRVDFAIGKGFFSRRKYRYPNQHFIAISEGVRRVLIKGGVQPERIDLVHSGAPPIIGAMSREESRRAFGIGEKETAIINTGALTDHKGHCFLVEAMKTAAAQFPNAKLHIMGEGELRGGLEELMAGLGIGDRVKLHGHVPEARLKLAGFDLYVSSSHLEGLGTAILDAMLAGLPVVAAAAGGVTDIVIDGETGRLTKVRDGKSLADGIGAALRDKEGSARMGAKAKAMVEDKFSARSMAEGTLAVYHRLLAGSKAELR